MDNLGRQFFQDAMRQSKRKLAQPGLYENVMGFFHAVRWNEPWILGALITYGVLLVLAVGFRKHQTLQMVIFVAICGAVFCAKYLNGFLAANWRALGFTQDYFDPHGIFLSLLYSSPLLLIGVFQMLYAFCTSISLLIKVKKKELKESMEKKKRDEAKRLQEEQGKPAALAAATAADGPAPKANSDNAGIAAVASAAEETKKER